MSLVQALRHPPSGPNIPDRTTYHHFIDHPTRNSSYRLPSHVAIMRDKNSLVKG
jgi:hypothetical protein